MTCFCDTAIQAYTNDTFMSIYFYSFARKTIISEFFWIEILHLILLQELLNWEKTVIFF